MTAPLYRSLDAHTGAPTSLADALTLCDRLITERDDAIAERDNMVNLAAEVGRLADYLKHALADRDEFRDMYLEYRDKYEGAQCRMDELAGELRDANASADNAIARLQTQLGNAQTALAAAKG